MPSLRAGSAVVALTAALVLGALSACGDGAPPPTFRSSLDGGDPAEKDAASAEVGTTIEPGPPSVQFIGRFDTRDPAGPACGWPGCRIIARFEGTAVNVDLEELLESWMEGGPSEWDVAIDGTWRQKIVTSTSSARISIATDLPPGPHVVELYKRSEAQNGVTRFRGFDFPGGALLAPPARNARRIEIVGDSQPAAFGVEGLDFPDLDCPGEDYAATWQNFRKSFGAVLGETLTAEVQGTVYSGKGMFKNLWRPDEETMPVLYPRANPIDPSSAADPSAWVPDAIVIMIGGNDFDVGQPDENDGNGPATEEEFTQAYRDFVATLRTTHPQTFLLLTVSPSVTDAQPPGREARTHVLSAIQNVTAERSALGDTKIATFEPALATASELTACNGHGNPAFHTRVAGELAVVLRSKLGW